MRIRPEHLRLQVERELTGKLLSLRGKYLLTDGKADAVDRTDAASLSTILVLFRAALRLYQDDVPAKKLDALHALRKHIEFDVEPFQRLFDMKQTYRRRAHDATFGLVRLVLESDRNGRERRQSSISITKE